MYSYQTGSATLATYQFILWVFVTAFPAFHINHITTSVLSDWGGIKIYLPQAYPIAPWDS